MNITMSPQQPMLSVTKAYPISDGNICGCLESERISGLSQTQIAELADAYAAAERTIICYGMGITQHEHGTQNVQQLVNLLLMKGNIGKPGAGICPLRGHSNVQGDRTVGITEKPSVEFLARLGERYGFTPPHVLDMLQLPACKQYVRGRLEH